MRAKHGLRYLALALLAPLGLLLAAACGGDSDSAPTVAASPMGTMEMDGDGEFAFGHPAEASEATRTIEIEAADTLKFDPASVELKAGETVTFRIHNVGATRHEFVVGTADEQEHHSEEMQEMAGSGAMMHDEPNAVGIEPGQTKELTWTFPEAGTAEFACHEPGHYPAGMKGTITVS